MSIDWNGFPFRFRTAARSGPVEALEELLRENEADLTPELLDQAFEAAIQGGQLASVGILAEILRKDPIHCAKALDKGAGEAALYGRLDVLKTLVEWGVDPTLRPEPETLIHRAAFGNGDSETLRWLSKFVDVDARDRDGATALMTTARALRPEPTEILLQLGADPSLRDPRGLQALDHARRGLADSVFEADWQDDRAYPSSFNRPADTTPAAELYVRVCRALESAGVSEIGSSR